MSFLTKVNLKSEFIIKSSLLRLLSNVWITFKAKY
jgi:hypothetical protein